MKQVRPYPMLGALLIVLVLLGLHSPIALSFDWEKLQQKIEKVKAKKKELKEKKQQLDLASGNVSQKDEINIGRNVASGLLGAAPLVKNDRLQSYINQVGHWIALQSDRPDLPWTFAIIASPHVNAFASPGGYIVVTLGLYELLENESQLAAILAHEISHVIEKHHLDAIQATSKREILGALAVKATSKKHREKMQRLVNSSVQIYARGLDKRYEFGADRRGVVLAARAGYDPYAMLDVLMTLRSLGTEDTMAVFLNTHPPLKDRIDNLEVMMDHYLQMDQIPDDNQRLQKINQSLHKSS